SQNIILDKSGNAKVADFGLALLATAKGDDGQKVDMCSGTIGYADPLYISTSVVTEKSEVYSFGMVLLELLTTKPPALQDPRTKAITEMYKGINKEKLWNMIDSRESRRPVFVEVAKALRELKRKSQSIAQQQQAAMGGPMYAAGGAPNPDMRNNV
ncbi:serine-threonine protein kinase, plant-type, putative, partial [Perkinsus marinus ATCC 50983]